jgi:PiT family inorganic phosphate transporter
MSPGEGFAANLVTTLLVGTASLVALPVSTTHVSSGAIIGIGLHRGAGTIHWRTVRDMLLAWLVTLPVSALVGAGAFALLR